MRSNLTMYFCVYYLYQRVSARNPAFFRVMSLNKNTVLVKYVRITPKY